MPVPSRLDDVLEALRDSLDPLVEQTSAQIYQDLDSYSDISREALAAAVSRNLNTSLTALVQHRVPTPSALDGAAMTARERYSAGVPVEEIVRGFRISMAHIHERFTDLALSFGLPAETILEGSRTLWMVGDAFTTRIITSYHDLELNTALRDAQRRAHVVRAVLAGERPDDPMLAAVNPQGSYAALRCQLPDGAGAEQLRRQLERSGSTPAAQALVVQDGESLLGMVSRRPRSARVLVGLGPFVPPRELARSDRVAIGVLRLAAHLGRSGVQSEEDLGWRLAAADHLDVWRSYHARFRAPLVDEGRFGDEMIAAIKSWLDHGRSITRTALALNLHVNTIRYRMTRFEELTGADLDDADDLIGVIWALELGDPEAFGR